MKDNVFKTHADLINAHILLHNNNVRHNCRVWAHMMGEAWQRENQFEEGYLLIFHWGQHN